MAEWAKEGLRFRTAQSVVADSLRRAILAGRLGPSQRLRQSEVAAQMRTSTTPVREALRELAAEGLLELDPHRGVVVHQCTLAELREIYEVRMLLEPLAIAATAERITNESIRAAEKLVTRMEQEDDVAEWVILNAEFHALLAEASGLTIVSSILSQLRNISALYVASSIVPHPERAKRGNEEHAAILRAVRDHDPAQAKATELVHLRSTLELSTLRFDDTESDALTEATV